jgi:hypothetical protein
VSLYFLHGGLNQATIHFTKVAMILLFFVSAAEMTLFNCLLFGMFLLLALSNNSKVLKLWKGTLLLTTLFICCQYSIRIFATNDYLLSLKHSELTNPICLVGILKC